MVGCAKLIPQKFFYFASMALVCAGFSLAGSFKAMAGQDRVVKVAGSTTVLPIASRAAELFGPPQSHLKITLNAGGSGVGVHGIGSGKIDIGMVSREVSPAEKTRYKNVRIKTHVVGRDAVACVVSSEVYEAGVKFLSREQIRDIYLGKITNWKLVGGPDRRIVVIDKERHRGTRHVFMKYIFGNANARAPGARLVTGSNNEEQSKIAQSDSAIGMLSFAWINKDVVGVGIREGDRIIHPTLENARKGTYPISRNLSLITAGEPEGPVKAFIDFIMGPDGSQIVRKAGYIPTYKTEGSKMVMGR